MKKYDYLNKIIWIKHGIANANKEIIKELGYNNMKVSELKVMLDKLRKEL